MGQIGTGPLVTGQLSGWLIPTDECPWVLLVLSRRPAGRALFWIVAKPASFDQFELSLATAVTYR